MIEWKKYDKYDRGIESHVTRLITDGRTVWTGFHASHQSYGYTWFGDDREPLLLPITHWAIINLP